MRSGDESTATESLPREKTNRSARGLLARLGLARSVSAMEPLPGRFANALSRAVLQERVRLNVMQRCVVHTPFPVYRMGMHRLATAAP
jgi:hypothetical protein